MLAGPTHMKCVPQGYFDITLYLKIKLKSYRKNKHYHLLGSTLVSQLGNMSTLNPKWKITIIIIKNPNPVTGESAFPVAY